MSSWPNSFLASGCCGIWALDFESRSAQDEDGVGKRPRPQAVAGLEAGRLPARVMATASTPISVPAMTVHAIQNVI